MALKKNRFTVKLFDGDCPASYAVFRKEAVKGLGRIVFYGQAQPVVCGLTRREAEYYRSKLDSEA